MYDLVCSIVIYKNPRDQLLCAINSFLNTELNVLLVLIDNSPYDDLKDIMIDSRIEYIHNSRNIGYGSAHNIAIKKYSKFTKYHLILNPDIYYTTGVIEEIITFMEKDKSIGLLMPKVLYPNGDIQYLAKLLPSPFILFIRRLVPFKWIKFYFSYEFELRFSDYNTIIEAPYLSGCFMVFRTSALEKINGFDENFFMHFEDLDIARRCKDAGFKNIFFPKKIIYHDHIHKSFLNIANLKMYIKSAVYYFNKYGWFFDSKRKKVNHDTIKRIKAAKQNF